MVLCIVPDAPVLTAHRRKGKKREHHSVLCIWEMVFFFLEWSLQGLPQIPSLSLLSPLSMSMFLILSVLVSAKEKVNTLKLCSL